MAQEYGHTFNRDASLQKIDGKRVSQSVTMGVGNS